MVKLQEVLKTLNSHSSNGSSLGPNFITGAQLSFGSVTSVIAGTAGKQSQAKDSTNLHDIVFNDTLSADPSTGVGAGGLDTGTEAPSTHYAVYIIDDSSGINSPALILSTSFAAPVLPIGYDIFRLLGSVYNNVSSDFRNFRMTGANNDRRIWYLNFLDGPSDISAGGDNSLSAFMPPISFEARLRVENIGGSGNRVTIQPTGPAFSSLIETNASVTSGSIGHVDMVDIITDTAQSVFVTTFGTSSTFINVASYVIEL